LRKVRFVTRLLMKIIFVNIWITQNKTIKFNYKQLANMINTRIRANK